MSATKNNNSKRVIQWIEERMKGYLEGVVYKETIKEDIKRAKYAGMTKHDFKKIIINLPTGENAPRFQKILTLLKEMDLL